MQILDGFAPVATWNVDDVYFAAGTQSMMPGSLGIVDDYVIRYTAFVCQQRRTEISLLLCSDDQAVAFIDGTKVSNPLLYRRYCCCQVAGHCLQAASCHGTMCHFVDVQVMLKRKHEAGHRRCYYSKHTIELSAGCHQFMIMHAHSGGRHGITLRMHTSHARRCAAHSLQRIPARLIWHPRACACSQLPDGEPVELEPQPSPPPPPPPPAAAPVVCPPAKLASKGWELCAWHIDDPDADIPESAQDLSGIAKLQVCNVNTCTCEV
jgi:hypothetical protein